MGNKALRYHVAEYFFRLREELDEVLGEDKAVTDQDIGSFDYLEKVMKESLRLHPPTPAITRITERDTRLGNVLIPANVSLMVNAFVLQNHPDYWENPPAFQPDRFNSSDKLHPYAYLPFSLGPRRCIGVQFAQLEVKLVITRLLKSFTINLVPGLRLQTMLHFVRRMGCVVFLHRSLKNCSL